jgi:hypothetical protein
MPLNNAYNDESPGTSQGKAFTSGIVAGVAVFSVGSLVVVGFMNWENPFCLTGWAAAIAAGVAAFKMGTPLGRVLFIGLMALIGSSLLFWFAACSMGTLILYSSAINWADPMVDMPKTIQAFKIVDLWGFILSVIVIIVAAVSGIMYGESADA